MAAVNTVTVPLENDFGKEMLLMKKKVAFLLTFCMMMPLAACGGSKTPTEPPVEEKKAAEVLSLQKSLQNHYEWEDDTLLVQSEHSYVTLREDDGEKIPCHGRNTEPAFCHAETKRGG